MANRLESEPPAQCARISSCEDLREEPHAGMRPQSMPIIPAAINRLVRGCRGAERPSHSPCDQTGSVIKL